jgi:hypothetical protein
MSQQFGEDAVQNTNPVTLTTTTETAGVTGNFLNPPFNTCKGVVQACVVISTGTGVTSVSVRVRRNPNAENLIVANFVNLPAAASSIVIFPVLATDAIPDGRPVQYQVTVQQNGATGNGTLSFSSIAAELISG